MIYILILVKAKRKVIDIIYLHLGPQKVNPNT